MKKKMNEFTENIKDINYNSRVIADKMEKLEKEQELQAQKTRDTNNIRKAGFYFTEEQKLLLHNSLKEVVIEYIESERYLCAIEDIFSSIYSTRYRNDFINKVINEIDKKDFVSYDTEEGKKKQISTDMIYDYLDNIFDKVVDAEFKKETKELKVKRSRTTLTTNDKNAIKSGILEFFNNHFKNADGNKTMIEATFIGLQKIEHQDEIVTRVVDTLSVTYRYDRSVANMYANDIYYKELKKTYEKYLRDADATQLLTYNKSTFQQDLKKISQQATELQQQINYKENENKMNGKNIQKIISIIIWSIIIGGITIGLICLVSQSWGLAWLIGFIIILIFSFFGLA